MINQPKDSHWNSHNGLKDPEQRAQQIRKQIQKLDLQLTDLIKDKNAVFDQQSQSLLKQHYTFPALVQKAERHREAFKIGKDPNTVKKVDKDGNPIDPICACCRQAQCQDTYSIICPPCSFIDQQTQKPNNNEIKNTKAKISRMSLYFTLLKGLIVYLLLRFLFYDLVSLTHSLSGFYCSELFKTHTGKCTYTLSFYNLKGNPVEGLHLDQLNALFTILSIIYFIVLKSIIDSNKRQFEKDLIEEDQFSLLVSNVPSYIISNLEQIYQHEKQTHQILQKMKSEILKQSSIFGASSSQINQIEKRMQEETKKIHLQRQINIDNYQIKNTQLDCQTKIIDLFSNRIRQLVKKKSNRMIAQYQYLLENTTHHIFSKLSKQKQIEIKERLTKEQDLLEQIGIKIIPVVNFCYDLAEINRINHLRKQASFQGQQGSDKQLSLVTQSKLIKKTADSLNNIEIFLQKKFENHSQIGFHAAHFSGKLLVSFQYKIFRDLIIEDYERNPNNFQINGKNLNIQTAAKPGDLNWQNINESKESKSTYTLHSWIVMIMVLLISFAAFTITKVIEKSMEVTTQENIWQVLKRHSFTLLSALVTTLINKGLETSIQVLVNMQKHSTKFTRQNSLIIKNLLAQSFNSLFIFILIYIIYPSNPLGPYGLAEKVISLAVVSNLSTFCTQVASFQCVCRNLKNFDFWNDKEKKKQPVPKFQIQLNKEYQYPKFNQQGMYISYTLMIFLVSFYGFLVPVITPIVFVSFIILYWVDKFNAFKRSSFDSFDDNRGDMILAIIQLSVLLSAISYFMWDLSIQKEPKLKLLNLVSIFFALYFTGYQAFVDIQIKNKIVQKDTKEGRQNQERANLSYEEAYRKFDKTYKTQNLTTKHCQRQEYNNQPKQRQIKQLTVKQRQKLAQQTSFKLITEVRKYEELRFRQQKDQIRMRQICSGCGKAMSHGKVYNVFCGHQVCVLCFWNNIYYKVETLSQISCIFCQKTIDPTLYMPKLQERLKRKAQQINSQKAKDPSCCKDCHFQQHQPNDCKTAFTQRDNWFQCPDCSLIIQPTNKCYNHFGTQLLQTKCLICVLGWSDCYNHKCRNQKAEPNCWFVNILTGILYIFKLVLIATLLVTIIVALYSIIWGLTLASCAILLPGVVIFWIFKCQWGFVLRVTLLLPLALIQGFIMSVRQVNALLMRQPCMQWFKENLSELPFQIKNRFYQHQAYKQAVFSYTSMKLYSKRRRIGYSLLMFVLLPLVFGLVAAFFAFSALVVLCFTLALLPFLISGEKRISVWIPIFFYPVMLIYYFAPLYSKFIWNQLKDLGYFYLNYILTMGKYLFCNCASNDDKEGTSLYEKDQDENLC